MFMLVVISTALNGVFPHRYGKCSVYLPDVDICDGVLKTRTGRVYISSQLRDQNKITRLLSENRNTIAGYGATCAKQVYRVICNFYFPTCGNSTHLVPPSSVCQEECEMVQKECQPTWDAALFALRDIPSIIDCNDTSKMLFPLPNCCRGLGKQSFLHAT